VLPVRAGIQLLSWSLRVHEKGLGIPNLSLSLSLLFSLCGFSLTYKWVITEVFVVSKAYVI
jgi:hypothetical protein